MGSQDPTPVPSPANPLVRPVLRTRRGRVYEPAIGPRLKGLLFVIFGSVAVLGATGVYLLAITLLEKTRGITVTNQFTLWMFIAHVALGVALVIPFLIFGFTHLATARHRPNRVAVRLGITLFIACLVVGATGLALIQLEKLPQLPTGTVARTVVYALHLLTPLVAVGLYVAHRRAGPEIRWRWGGVWGLGVGVFVLGMCLMHSHDPRKWGQVGPREGELYFEPSRARTSGGNFIPVAALMTDDYCIKCHKDVYDGWFHSAHHFSSFNNPPYLSSVRETRQVSLKRDGSTRASRWCAGCHDPVPFFSGQFDNPNFDDVNHPTAKAGITCVSCHAITNVNSPVGNGDYTIEEPLYYPFTYSTNAFLQWVNNQVLKARPDFHKKTMLKDFHRTAEFCSTCHKVAIPPAVTHYREFQRGQNHYDTYLLSGASGVGARSFYYPPEAKTNCAACHMPLKGSQDFGSKDFDGSGLRKIHDHSFPGGNTGLPDLLRIDPRHGAHADGFQQAVDLQSAFLRGTDPEGKDRPLHVDLFALKDGGTIDGKLTVLRPGELPKLKPGATYLVEVVVRTLNMGHVFPQGTADSNEIWVDFVARAGDRVIGRSGALAGPGEAGPVDEWAHFINVLMLDRDGNRINRRNPQDIFTPLYDHQIPPGAAQIVHYRLKVPEDVRGPVDLKVKVRYRKFDHEYMKIVYADSGKVPALPVVDLCEDHVLLPVAGQTEPVPPQVPVGKPAWQRWNDYGIACLLEGGVGSKKGELKQAEEAFRHVTTLGKDVEANGYVNMARVYFDEGRLHEAVQALTRAQTCDPPAPWWVAAWFSGLVDAQNGHLDKAIESFRKILDPRNAPADHKFNFSRDYVVINELGLTLFRRAQQEDDPAERDAFLRQAVEQYERTLQIDPEDLDAHYGLAQCYARLGEGAEQFENDGIVGTADEATLIARMKEIVDTGRDREERLRAAFDLTVLIPQYGRADPDPKRPKLPVLQRLIADGRIVYNHALDPALRTAAGKVLGALHRQTHLLLKPDDNAKDRAVRIYREKHHAAAAASQAVVLYPTDRFSPAQ